MFQNFRGTSQDSETEGPYKGGAKTSAITLQRPVGCREYAITGDYDPLSERDVDHPTS